MDEAGDMVSEMGFAESFDDAVEWGRALGGDSPAAATAASGAEVERRIRRLESVELSTDELSDLAARADAGDGGARDRLLARCLPMVMRVARGYSGRDVELADLVQEGVLGLLRALERFDPDRGVPLAPYAGWWQRQAMRQAIAEQSHRCGFRLTSYGISTSCVRREASCSPAGDGRPPRRSLSESWAGHRAGWMTCGERSVQPCRWTRRTRATRTPLTGWGI